MAWSNRRGFPVDPNSSVRPGNAEKRALIRECAKLWRLRTFVETGIYQGDCAALEVGELFDAAFVIDPGADNCMRALQALPIGTVVRVLPGDSAVVLPDLLMKLTKPALFWLDAHGMDEENPSSPLLRELGTILCWKHAAASVVLIDDMRLMGVVPGWPSLDELADLCEPMWEVAVEMDVMRCARVG